MPVREVNPAWFPSVMKKAKQKAIEAVKQFVKSTGGASGQAEPGALSKANAKTTKKSVMKRGQ